MQFRILHRTSFARPHPLTSAQETTCDPQLSPSPIQTGAEPVNKSHASWPVIKNTGFIVTHFKALFWPCFKLGGTPPLFLTASMGVVMLCTFSRLSQYKNHAGWLCFIMGTYLDVRKAAQSFHLWFPFYPSPDPWINVFFSKPFSGLPVGYTQKGTENSNTLCKESLNAMLYKYVEIRTLSNYIPTLANDAKWQWLAIVGNLILNVLPYSTELCFYSR